MAYRFDERDNSIVVSGWEEGIADNPFNGISNMKSGNIISTPGQVSTNFTFESAKYPAVSGLSFTATNGSATLTNTGSNNLVAGMAVTVSGGSLPTGLTASTVYYVISATSTTFTLGNTFSGSAIVMGSNGSGTLTTINIGQPRWSTVYYSETSPTDPVCYIIDYNGRVWASNFGGYWYYLKNTTLTNANGNGIAVYKGYLFVFRNNRIDYVLVTGDITGNTWTYGWQNLLATAGNSAAHQAFVGTDDVLYWCDGSYVGSVMQKSAGTPFDPANATTYTFTNTALTLPSGDFALCLEELGTNLLVGGQKNYIYPWDRISPTFSYPILVAEENIWRMKTVNNNTYIFTGTRGRIYVTNGSQAQLFKKVPDHISGSTIEPTFTWGGVGSQKNQLYFGIYDNATSNYNGVWGIDLDTQAMRRVFTTTGDVYSTTIPSVIQPQKNANLFVGWNDLSGNYGIDQLIGFFGNTYGTCTIETDIIPVGTFTMPQNFQQIEYKLSRPLASGDSILIEYRLNFSANYATALSDSTSGNFSNYAKIPFKNAQWVQFRITLTPAPSNTSGVRLTEMRIR